MTNRSTPPYGQDRHEPAPRSPFGDDRTSHNGSVPGQQQQFEAQGANQQPAGDTGIDSLARRIREHMPVVDHAGGAIGTVDHVEGGYIKLTRDGGEHNYLPIDLVAGIEGGQVRLRAARG